jgi:predicted RNA-binding Zn-ribbon protein involved in translation (DUF1610 family)
MATSIHLHRRGLLALMATSTLLLITLLPTTVAASDGCSASSTEFACPNCGGITVSDCMKCDGYLFADYKHELCYDRKLFHVEGNEEGDPDNHYPFLWNDV